ncbi:MAG TPA: hypothetical protein VK607_21355 [Kofleriaceae bacterium]|nr:hypothetical protein [Kofleriaceae bacterium]
MFSQRTLTLTLATALVGLSAAAPRAAHAQALPTPFQLESGADFECYRTPGPALDRQLMLTHLNPVLIQLGLPQHQVIMRELAQTCVPVRKNNSAPAPAALPFVSQMDLACYRVDAAPLPNPVPLNLTHLNPVLANLPQHNVTLVRPVQLCVPVAKNGVLPPPAVLALAQLFDVECYQLEPAPHPQFALGITQLNPQLLAIPPHPITLVSSPRQLCVPVRKNNQVIPPGILSRIRWLDSEKFAANPSVMIAPVDVELTHLNPLLAGEPPVHVKLQEANSLMVPVAKNGAIPPND